MTKPHTERRLAAILAADVAGYSRLMGADEAGTAQALREHLAAITPIVTSHSGRVVKTTGDGVLLDFSSIVAAVECAAAVQQLMAERNAELPQDRQMLFRIGVNLGDVLIEGEDILGDGVNIAASKVLQSQEASAYPMTLTDRFKGRSLPNSLTAVSSS